jgi:predicted dehydrogenase
LTVYHEPPIRVGIAGCGYWGSKHLRVFNELPGAEVAALCEPSAEKVGQQPRGFLPPIVTGDYDRFLDSGIDAVVIATPARTHYELARRALEADKHVLVEKPFATDSSDALDLISDAERRGLTIGVGHTYVYHPAVRFLRDLVDRGDLGRLHYIHSARLNFGLLQPDVNVLWDLAPHDLSIMHYVLQAEPLTAAARGTPLLTNRQCEVAHLDLEFAGGPMAHVYVSWLEPTKVRRLTFIADEATIVYDDIAQGGAIRIYNQSIKIPGSNGYRNNCGPEYVHGDASIPFLTGDEPLKAECTDFINSIRTGGAMASDGWAGLRVVRVLEAAQRSLRNGGGSLLVPYGNGLPHNEGLAAATVAQEPVR